MLLTHFECDVCVCQKGEGTRTCLEKESGAFQMCRCSTYLSLAGNSRFSCCEALRAKPLCIGGAFCASTLSTVSRMHGTLVPCLYLRYYSLVGWISRLQYLMYNSSALLFWRAFNLWTYLWLCLLFFVTVKCDERSFLGPLIKRDRSISSLFLLFVLYICWCSFYQPLSARHICYLHLLLCPERHCTSAWCLPSAYFHRFGTRRTNGTRVQSISSTIIKLAHMQSWLLRKCLPIEKLSRCLQ